MIIGGAAGSTVGGIKLKRLLSLLEAIAWRFRRPLLSPNQFAVRQINGELLNSAQASRRAEDAAIFSILWLILVILSVLILLRLVSNEYGLSDVIFEATSALGAAGLSVGITSPSLHWMGKVTMVLLMWLGRLEIFPFFFLLMLPVSTLKHLKQ